MRNRTSKRGAKRTGEARFAAARGSGEITALEIVALHIDANSKAGTPEHAEAAQMLEDAKQMWREKFTKKCPHCGSRLNAAHERPANNPKE